MSDPNLNESAWHRAKADAASAYRTPAFGIGVTLVGLLFASISLIASEGQPATTKAGISIFSGVLSMVVTLGFTLLVQLAAAPVRQRNELRESWPSRSDQPNDLALKLWNAYRKGVDLEERLEDEPAANVSYDRRKVEEWSEETAVLLADGVPTDVGQQFFAAGQYLATLAERVEARTAALKEIIDGLG